MVTLNTVGDLPGLGTAWCHKNWFANIPLPALVSDVFRITLDAGIDQAFFIHRPNGTTKRFPRVDMDLCVCDTKGMRETVLVTTAAGQKKTHSDLDCRRAKAAKTL